MFAFLLNLFTADTPPRHGGKRGWGSFRYTPRHGYRLGCRPAYRLVQWLIQERQGGQMTFPDFCRLQVWKEEQEWITMRLASGGW